MEVLPKEGQTLCISTLNHGFNERKSTSSLLSTSGRTYLASLMLLVWATRTWGCSISGWHWNGCETTSHILAEIRPGSLVGARVQEQSLSIISISHTLWILSSVGELWPLVLHCSHLNINAKPATLLKKSFKAVAKAHGCGSASSQVECLRNVSWQEIERHLATAEGQTFTFLPIADEKLVFSNYSQRYEMDALSSIPAIVGTNQHELNALAVDNAAIKYNNILSPLTNSSFLCTAAATSRLREATCRTTYRYRYDGNFSNISPGILHRGISCL